MTLEMIPAYDVPLAEQAKIFSRAFTGYVGGSFEMDAAGLARFILHQGADLSYSYFARTAEGLAGFAYINRTGNISRVAGMGVVPAARRAGLARRLLAHLLEEAQTRGDQAMMLEVIEQNPAAHRLYLQQGFRETAHLLKLEKEGQCASNRIDSAARGNFANQSQPDTERARISGPTLANLTTCHCKIGRRLRFSQRPCAHRHGRSGSHAGPPACLVLFRQNGLGRVAKNFERSIATLSGSRVFHARGVPGAIRRGSLSATRLRAGSSEPVPDALRFARCEETLLTRRTIWTSEASR